MKRINRKLLYIILLLVALIPAIYRFSNFALQELKLLKTETVSFAAAKTASQPNSQGVRYLIIVKDTGDDKEFSKVLPNLKMAFQYSKLPLDVITWEDWNKAPRDLTPYVQGAVILLAEDESDLKWADKLKAYTEQSGGLLVNAWSSSNSPLNEFFGIQGEPQFVTGDASGLHWTTKFYPGLSDQDLTKNYLQSSSLDVTLSPEMKVWAESVAPKRVPYLWYGERGHGRVLVYNLTSLATKYFRGVFIQGVLKAQPVSVKASVGGQVWFIDDFPSPVGINQVTQGNKTGMTDYQFRLKQFDPDMEHIANKYGIRFSTGIIMTYSNNVTAPFLIPKYEELYHLESIIGRGGELGLHGYNHQPLVSGYSDKLRKELGYNPWPSTDDMKGALQTARENWQQLFKTPLPTMYIPPSNMLSTEGEKTLLDMFPELKTISSIYTKDVNEGTFEQEFLPDPKFPQIMGTPRASYGYILNSNQKFELYSVVANLGIVSHFNHPDDVFDPDRNHDKPWTELRDSFDSVVGDVNQRFGWLRPLTATQLSDALRVYHEAHLNIDRSEPGLLKVSVTPLQGPLFLEVRVPSQSSWHIKQGGSIVKEDKEYGILWIRVDDPNVVMEEKR
ncbi:DUF2194 domain-containing protein [Ectobacillus panaciterrae]|uniref:DUF2194 domain-containing protein n=1 Tax=Ectobacillus panaciterrae TaxID=363872 RepID=UPI000401B512|nr:DUF2194 domain-containing protein [Ectobacillus panaciterrae]